MSRIEWAEAFSVQHPEIDEQHKKWVSIYNNIHDVLIGAGPSSSSLANITSQSITEMYEYARTHFTFEEAYLEQLKYPQLFEHRRLHRDFEDLLYRYSREIKEGQIILNTSLLKILKNWLVDHILTEDKKFSTFRPENIPPTP